MALPGYPSRLSQRNCYFKAKDSWWQMIMQASQAQHDTGRAAGTGKHLHLFLAVQSRHYFYEIMLLHW